jgi:hypothetical protein
MCGQHELTVSRSRIPHTDTEELKRREAFEAADPVYNTLLTAFVRERLSQAQQLGMNPYWEKLDVDVKRQLETLLN